MTKQELEAFMEAHEERHHRKTDGKLWTFAAIADKILRVALVAFMAWFAKEIYANKGSMTEVTVVLKQLQITQAQIITQQKEFEVWRASTSANRFTLQDGAKLLDRHVSDINKIEQGQAEIIKQIAELPSKLPPAWVVERINANSDDIKELRRWRDGHVENHP